MLSGSKLQRCIGVELLRHFNPLGVKNPRSKLRGIYENPFPRRDAEDHTRDAYAPQKTTPNKAEASFGVSDPKGMKICASTLIRLAIMSYLTYVRTVSKPLRWLSGEVKTPPMSTEARREMGFLLRQLQEGENLSLPHSRPMP